VEHFEGTYHATILLKNGKGQRSSLTTLSAKGLHKTLSISDTRHNNALPYAECHYAECRFLYTIMLNVIMLSVMASLKQLARANGLAYFRLVVIDKEKIVITLTPGCEQNHYEAIFLLKMFFQIFFTNC
jgi:hypothetical protein